MKPEHSLRDADWRPPVYDSAMRVRRMEPHENAIRSRNWRYLRARFSQAWATMWVVDHDRLEVRQACILFEKAFIAAVEEQLKVLVLAHCRESVQNSQDLSVQSP
jgi:hypothetical protein